MALHTQGQFEDALERMLDEAKAATKSSIKISAGDLSRRVSFDKGVRYAQMACNAMRKALAKYGGEIVSDIGGPSSTFMIKYNLCHFNGKREVNPSPRQFVFEGMEVILAPLVPFVEERLRIALRENWQKKVRERLEGRMDFSNGRIVWDQRLLLRVISLFWHEAFRGALPVQARAWAGELIDVGNKLAHSRSFSYDEAERALDTMRRLMEAIGADKAAEKLKAMRQHVLQIRFPGLETGKPPQVLPSKLDLPAPTKAGGDTPPSRMPSVMASLAPSPRSPARAGHKIGIADYVSMVETMLDGARREGKSTCRIVSGNLHRHVARKTGDRANRMPTACAAMWKLWRTQGSRESKIIHTTPSGKSSTIEIEFDL